MNILIIGIVAAWFLIGILLIAKKKLADLGKIMITLGVIPLVVVAVFIGILVLAFSSTNTDFYSMILAIFGFLIVIFTPCALWGVLKKKAAYITFCVCFSACIIAAVSFWGYQQYLDKIPTVGEEENLLVAYAPYVENSKVVDLEEESELKLTADIPKMDGATALYPIYSAFPKAVYPKELIDSTAEYLRCTKTTGAYESIVTGDADIIFAAAPSEKQKQFAKENGVELIYTPIGKEAFVFFVNAKNPINDMTVEQIQKIYSGEITTWDALNVASLGEIKAFQRAEDSGSQSALQRLMEGLPLMTPPESDIIDGMGGIIKQTADYKNFKNAIGFSFRFYSTEMVQNNQIKLLSINGIFPNIENIENGTYPIASEFYAVTRSDASENTKKLVAWILSEQGQKIIEMTGYTPIQ